jgi:hypothetical protein
MKRAASARTQVSASKNSVAQPMRAVRAPDCRDGNQQPTTSGVAGKRQHTMNRRGEAALQQPPKTMLRRGANVPQSRVDSRVHRQGGR